MRIEWLPAIAMLFTPAIAAAGVDDLLPVHGTSDFQQSENGAGLVAAKDGAVLVVCRALVLECREGARVEASCDGAGGPVVTVSDGGFFAHAGSVQVEIRLGDDVIPLRGATLDGVYGSDGWKVTTGGASTALPAKAKTLSAEAGTRVPLLRPRAVEDPKDFAAASSGHDLSVGALEIDSIEVEVGCVEVCVD